MKWLFPIVLLGAALFSIEYVSAGAPAKSPSCSCVDCDCYPKCKCSGPAAAESPMRALPIGDAFTDLDARTIWSYAEGVDLARRTKLPLVTYIGGDRHRARTDASYITAYTKGQEFPATAQIPGASVSLWVKDGLYGHFVPENQISPAFVEAKAAEIRAWAESPNPIVVAPARPARPGCPNCPGGVCPIRR